MAKASQAVILENEFYIIKAPNGKVLEVKNFNTENGAAIQLWSYAGHPWQQWQFVDAGEGRWRICNRFTGKMMDLALGGVVEGTWLHQWDRTSGLSQCWALEPTRSGRTRIRNVLASFDVGEQDDMIEPDGKIHVTCEYCSKVYRLAPEDVKPA